MTSPMPMDEALRQIEQSPIFVTSIPPNGFGRTRNAMLHLIHAFKNCKWIFIWVPNDKRIKHAYETKTILGKIEEKHPNPEREVHTFFGDAEGLWNHIAETTEIDLIDIELEIGGYKDD